MPWQDLTWNAADGLTLHLRDFPGPAIATGPPVVCIPGLTRNARDFEDLAEAVSARHRVLCVDLRGRGGSDWDPKPENYHPGTYVADLLALFDALELEQVALVGTSLGGLVTMLLAGARPGLVSAAVINDIGPVIDPAGLARIAGYVGQTGPFESWREAADAVRAANEVALPGLSAGEWQAMARRTCFEDEAGRIRFDYDPGIARPMATSSAPTGDLDPWALFAPLADVPTLVVRGESSDILSEETLAEMRARKPDLACCIVPGRGHAPLLDEPACRPEIVAFLSNPTPS